ncbi:cytochrome P450 [Zychaea mexicana]|uniref:cytochrome P450 n=1 Tax=Zychaea mexicana TaxID=64656 RepID=UPI0022FF0C16|nr:cytochrome P450 [Zychaea mexicana]KAI9493596.1 cytochrome P450 [Zychaea mexicana]
MASVSSSVIVRIKDKLWSTLFPANGASSNALLSQNRTRSVAIAVALLGLYLAFEKITKPPKHLRHIPQANFFKYVSSFLTQQPYDETAENITVPISAKTEHGSYIVFDVYGWTVHVTRPESAKKLLLKADLFPKINMNLGRRDTLFGRFAMGPNIIFLIGKHWKEQRSVMNPAFHRSMPVHLFGDLTRKLFVELDKQLESPIEIHEVLERWTLDAIGIAGFDFDFNSVADPTNEWVTRYNSIMKANTDPLFMLLPSLETRWLFLFPKRKQAHKELDIFLGKIREIIAKKRETLVNDSSIAEKRTSEKDLLTLMLEASEEGNGKLTDEELQSNLCAFFLAGHDTTANALSYAIYNLATHPDVQEKAREEANLVLGDKSVDVLPTLEQIQQMPYINQVIKETMRRNVTATGVVAREATEDTDLGGVYIPKGTRVTVDIMEIQRNVKVWKDPKVFDPERFAPGGEAEKVAKMGMSWLPFSNGARQCIGMNFSLAEQRVFLPMLLRKYELSLPEDSIHKDKVVISGVGIMTPVNLRINLKRRF